MRPILTIIFVFLYCAVNAQTYLYNQRGISLYYSTSVKKSVFCKEENKTVHFVNLHYTVVNNSGQAARITSRLQMCDDAFAKCLTEVDVFHYEGNGRSNFQDNKYLILKSGESYYGDVGAWYYETTAEPCAWGITPEFAVKGTTLKIDVDLNSSNQKKKQPTYGIYQNDNVVNPKPQVNYSQKQKEQDSITNNAMQSWKNSYQDNMKQVSKINNLQNNINQQQQQNNQNLAQQQLIQQQQAQQKQIEVQQFLEEQQQRYQKTEMELDNAKNVSMNAYQEAINNGKQQSRAMLDASLAGAQQISDAKSSLIYTGIGLGISLFMHLSEKKAAQEEKEEERRAEQERINLIINTKNDFIKEALDINKYSVSDLVSKDRYAIILVIPKQFTTDEDVVYFTYSVPVPKYSDGTYPLKPEVEKKLLISIDRNISDGKTVHTLYPITNLETFNNDFVKKMGSAKVININAQLLKLTKSPFSDSDGEKGKTDFWGNPAKSNTLQKKEKPIKVQQQKTIFGTIKIL